jgi:hypothetical protein
MRKVTARSVLSIHWGERFSLGGGESTLTAKGAPARASSLPIFTMRAIGSGAIGLLELRVG